MGKKKIRKSKTSKGTRPSIAKETLKLVRRGVDAVDQHMHKVIAWRAGKNPWITVPNRETGTNRPFYRVRANDAWGNPKFLSSGLFKDKSE